MGSRGEDKMLDLRGVERGAQSIAPGTLSKMLAAWDNIVKAERKDKNALLTFGGALELSDHARGSYSVNAPFNSVNYLDLRRKDLIETALKWDEMKHDLTALITLQNQYHFPKRLLA
ncbi:hypothetical protein Plhal304r1_c031g0100711 [Plasmopara halstedii]